MPLGSESRKNIPWERNQKGPGENEHGRSHDEERPEESGEMHDGYGVLLCQETCKYAGGKVAPGVDVGNIVLLPRPFRQKYGRGQASPSG